MEQVSAVVDSLFAELSLLAAETLLLKAERMEQVSAVAGRVLQEISP